jgi:hypothetical protein
MTLQIGEQYVIEGRRVTLVRISEQPFGGRIFRYYTVEDGQGRYSYDQETVRRLGGFSPVATSEQRVNQRMAEYFGIA